MSFYSVGMFLSHWMKDATPLLDKMSALENYLISKWLLMILIKFLKLCSECILNLFMLLLPYIAVVIWGWVIYDILWLIVSMLGVWNIWLMLIFELLYYPSFYFWALIERCLLCLLREVYEISVLALYWVVSKNLYNRYEAGEGLMRSSFTKC